MMLRLKDLVILAAVCLPAVAQDNWCSADSNHSNNTVTHAEVREERLAGAAQLFINPAQNGSIKVHGWANADIQLKACVRGTATDSGQAEAIAKEVSITDGPGRIVAKGPQPKDTTWWSVSYEVWMPAAASLKMETFNGSISVDSVIGPIHANTLNGSVKLKDVGGDVDSSSTNGSVTFDLAGGHWNGHSIGLKTTNGSIHLNLPADFSAQIDASTVNGSLRTDFPVQRDPERKHNLNFTLGAGGTKIEAATINGSVHIGRS